MTEPTKPSAPPPPAPPRAAHPRRADDTRESLAARAREVAARAGVDRLSMAAFRRATKVGDRRIYRHFESWGDLCRAAGLTPVEARRPPSDAELFAAMRDAFLAAGCIAPQHRLERHLPWSAAVPRLRWGGWHSALVAFRDWVETEAPDFALRDELEMRVAKPPRRGAGERDGIGPPWPALGGRAAGEAIGFRAMLHAPVNEQGVVLLFGMVAAELGYAIDTVQPGFPDATAKRRTGAARWESVRIEFEFRSRSFREHGHDAAGCDVIVCWAHDWPDCPLEVLCLKDAIAAL